MRRPTVFFAIPCGEFYSTQRGIINSIALSMGIEPIIAEDDLLTDNLWDVITEGISRCDLFMADISSASPNVVVELGYALRDKPRHRVGIFCSENAKKPADLLGFRRQQYSSLTDFRQKLASWFSQCFPLTETPLMSSPVDDRVIFHEDFKDQDAFLRRWAVPPIASYVLSSEGLRFGNAHLPISTTCLAILRNYEVSFFARILSERLGWAVLLSTYSELALPKFCVMFNIDKAGRLRPHIYVTDNLRSASNTSGYETFASKDEFAPPPGDRWFHIRTRIFGDVITVLKDDVEIFSANFAEDPFGKVYLGFDNKEGQVGFRCHRGEEGLIREVRVCELDVP